jgi:hypothetical protein
MKTSFRTEGNLQLGYTADVGVRIAPLEGDHYSQAVVTTSILAEGETFTRVNTLEASPTALELMIEAAYPEDASRLLAENTQHMVIVADQELGKGQNALTDRVVEVIEKQGDKQIIPTAIGTASLMGIAWCAAEGVDKLTPYWFLGSFAVASIWAVLGQRKVNRTKIQSSVITPEELLQLHHRSVVAKMLHRRATKKEVADRPVVIVGGAEN